ncbi:hypothetical protein WA026_019317 [Henosepilachna vigintioctopunctata]|uniref:JmjC domain-containing protein n=1 Tax=Henosepilachna vigintioctopunctata TaxID=420089 RepID=A0AAW1U1P8_9CUCU
MKFVRNCCRNRGVWLPIDTVMLPPSVLIESGVSLSRTLQEPGQFIVVSPKASTWRLSTGYVVSESVFLAPPAWLKTAHVSFDLLKDSCEPSMFSLDRLFISIMNDQRTSVEVLKQVIPIVAAIFSKEKPKRDIMRSLGITKFEILPPPEIPNARKKINLQITAITSVKCIG